MHHKSSKGRKYIIESATPKRKTEPNLAEVVDSVQRTPTKSSEWFLSDERFDLIPKTDYTYARTGSYSPRFLDRKYVNPNMSRYRIRGPQSGMMSGDDDDLEYEFSDDDVIPPGKDQRDVDLDSEDSYEIVYKDGMVLRSGHNLRTLESMIREHDGKEVDQNTNYSHSNLQIDKNISGRNALTSRKIPKSAKSSKQYSQSERKRQSVSGHDSDSATYSRSRAELRARKNLSSQFDTSHSHTNSDSYTRSNLDTYSRSKSGSYSSRDYRSYDYTDSRNSKSYDQVDGSYSVPGYSLKTVSKTVTEEYEDFDEGREKAERELSEKQTISKQVNKNQTVNHLYGLDSEDEFSDGDSYGTRRTSSRYSLRNGSSQYSDSTTSVTTTVITTITETISTITRPVVVPVWNHVGKPLWRTVGSPLLTLISLLSSAIWSVVKWPVTTGLSGATEVVSSVASWLWSNGLNSLSNSVMSVPLWLQRKVEYMSMQMVVLDIWLFKRGRRRGCCLCLPLLLLLPLLFTILAGTDLSSAKTAFMGFWVREETPVKPVIGENNQFITQLNEEVRLMILQLQSNAQSQLTAAEVELIVRRILDPELAALRTSMQGDRNEAYAMQNQIKAEQADELKSMSHKHADLIALIENLQGEISKQKEYIKEQDGEAKAESAAYLAELEEKLTVLQAALRDLEEKQKAILLRLKECCKNDTYLAALVHERVNAILADTMAGHLSGNPGQDAFTHWLHSNYVSREDLDKRLETLAADLTESVMAMLKSSEEAQVAAAVAAASRQQEESHQQRVVVAGNGSGIGAEQVRTMIDEALFRYSADKTGLADFGLESAGGTIVSTRCSETYYRKTALVSVFGIPLWYTSNSPRTVIQPDVHPGQCWAFRGAQGYIVIQTSTIIFPSGFTLEHIPKSLAPSGEIDSAPKDFTVLGLSSEYDGVGISLGNYTYKDEGKPVQFFPVQRTGEPKPFNMIELKILSNYGNQEYTCLYRFRIHGKPYKP